MASFDTSDEGPTARVSAVSEPSAGEAAAGLTTKVFEEKPVRRDWAPAAGDEDRTVESKRTEAPVRLTQTTNAGRYDTGWSDEREPHPGALAGASSPVSEPGPSKQGKALEAKPGRVASANSSDVVEVHSRAIGGVRSVRPTVDAMALPVGQSAEAVNAGRQAAAEGAEEEIAAQPSASPVSLRAFATFAKSATESQPQPQEFHPLPDPKASSQADFPPVVAGMNSPPPRNTVHIGSVDIQIIPPAERTKPVTRPARDASAAILSRGFTSWFGLRQG